MKRFEIDYTTTLYVDYWVNCNIGSTRVYGMLIGNLGNGQYSVRFIPGDEVLAELLGL